MNIQNIHNSGHKIHIFERLEDGSLIISEDDSFYPYYFEQDLEGQYLSYDEKKLRKILCHSPTDVSKNRSANSYESDITFTKRYILDKISKFDKTILKYLFLDIEILANELPDTAKADYPISCITIYNSLNKEYKTWFLKEFSAEEDMLREFVDYIKNESPDLISCWNVNFDYSYLYNRIGNFPRSISPISDSRVGKQSCYYPAGISIIDYKGLFEKLTLNKRRSYALDYIAQEDLNEKSFGNTEFGTLNDKVKEKNINDVVRMVKLEEKFKIFDHFDEIRRLCKCLWEDLPQETLQKDGKMMKVSNNSKIIDMLMLDEAKKMGFVLPKKPDYNYEGNEFKQLIAEAQTEGFEGAYRDQFDTGLFFNVGKYDLNSAYPQMISDFCLDPKNLSENEGLKIQLKTRVENKETDVYYFKQNENALLPKVIKSLLVLKNELKEKSKSEDEILKQQYAAVKSICNSAYGVFGNKYFRLFSKPVAETTTFLVRDLLRYIKDNLEQDNYSVLYLDTDSVFVDDKGDDITFILNDLIQTWALKYQKRSYIEFTYEGHFESLLLLKKCHYYGYVKGKTKPEIRGMEVKRSSSSKYEAKFQNELVNKVLKKEKKESIIDWIRTEQERIKTLSFGELGFPAKIASKDYKVETIFSRAVNNSRDLFNLKIGFGELFYYIFVHPIGKDNNGKSRDVIAITENLNLNNKKHLIQINWEETIRRSITSKTENIFEAMKWENPKLQLSDQTSLF